MIFLAGSTGYLGSHILLRFIKGGKEVICLDRADLSSPTELLSSVAGNMGERNLVINAAGYAGRPNVDSGEKEKGVCVSGNVSLPVRISNVCQVFGLPMIHVSTGCIYTGHQKAWEETDEPNFDFRHNNCSFYSGTKALAEEVLADCEKTWILRPRVPFCRDIRKKKNFISKIMLYPRLIETTNSVTNVEEFANVVFECYDKKIPYGTYNVVNDGPLMISELVELLDKYGHIDKNSKAWFEDKESFLKTVSCPRSECVLSTKKLNETGIHLSQTHDLIESILRYE